MHCSGVPERGTHNAFAMDPLQDPLPTLVHAHSKLNVPNIELPIIVLRNVHVPVSTVTP
jgi:hypothetical protein